MIYLITGGSGCGKSTWAEKLVESLPAGKRIYMTANEMFDNGDPNLIVPALRNLAERCRHLIMVTNDLFSDGVIYSSSVQEYLRRLADINRQAAAMADCVIEVVYSIPVALKGEVPCL